MQLLDFGLLSEPQNLLYYRDNLDVLQSRVKDQTFTDSTA